MAYIPPTNQSVSGTVGASVIGLAPVSVSNFPANQSVSGTVVTTQLAGSILATSATATANQSVSGTVNIAGNVTVVSSIAGGIFPVSGSVAAIVTNTVTVVSSVAGGLFPISGSVSAVITNSPTVIVNNGSVVAFQGTSPWVVAPNNSSIITQIGTRTTSLVSTVPSSVIVGASIFGQLPAGTAMLGSVTAVQGTSPWVVNFQNSSIIATQLAGSILATSATVNTGNSSVTLLTGTNLIGSVATLQGTNPWIVAPNNSSIISIPTGSIVAVNDVTRNDTLSSIVGADLTSRVQMGDAIGRVIVKPFASEDSTIISYVGSIVSGSVQLIQASAIGKKSYVTDFWLSNTGATTTLVTLQDGSTSVLGQFIAPAAGGMSSSGLNIPLKTNNSQDLAFKVSPSTSVLYLSLKGYQAQ